jgi:hypothetical protein
MDSPMRHIGAFTTVIFQSSCGQSGMHSAFRLLVHADTMTDPLVPNCVPLQPHRPRSPQRRTSVDASQVWPRPPCTAGRARVIDGQGQRGRRNQRRAPPRAMAAGMARVTTAPSGSRPCPPSPGRARASRARTLRSRRGKCRAAQRTGVSASRGARPTAVRTLMMPHTPVRARGAAWAARSHAAARTASVLGPASSSTSPAASASCGVKRRPSSATARWSAAPGAFARSSAPNDVGHGAPNSISFMDIHARRVRASVMTR